MIKKIIGLAILILVSINISAQRNTSYKQVIATDIVDWIGLSGNLQYEFFDKPQRGIVGHVMIDFAHADITTSGSLSRRYYLQRSEWSAYVAPFTSFIQLQGEYNLPDIEQPDGTIVDGGKSTYKGKSWNLGGSIGYSYVGFNKLSAGVEIGYGFPLWHEILWKDQPSTGAEDTFKGLVAIVFNVTVGYAF